MSDDMLVGREQLLTKVLPGVLGKIASRLTGPDAKEWEAAAEKFIRREDPWEDVRELLKLESTIRIGSTDWLLPRSDLPKFSPAEYFCVGKPAGTNQRRFRSVDERIAELFGAEERFGPHRLAKWSLLFATRGSPLYRELGLKSLAPTLGFGQIWCLLGGWDHPLVLAENDDVSEKLFGLRENLIPVRDKDNTGWTISLWSVPGKSDSWDVGLHPRTYSRDRYRRRSLVFTGI